MKERLGASLLEHRRPESTCAASVLNSFEKMRPFHDDHDFDFQNINEILYCIIHRNNSLLFNLSQLLKDFYLLGRGEIFRSLIEKSKDLLKVPPTGNTGHSK
jgi:hypothetical protein